MKMKRAALSTQSILPLIHTIRGCRVILAADLAWLFDVETKRLNEQVRRNGERFPADFMFQLTVNEADALQSLRSQIATLKQGMQVLAANKTILKRLADIDKTLLHHNTALRDVYEKLLPLLQPPPNPPRPKIGFREPLAKYGSRK